MPAASTVRARRALLAILLLIGVAPSEAQQPAVKQVLVLQSFDRGILVVDHFTGDFRHGLVHRAGDTVNLVQVVVGPTGFVGAPEQSVVDYIRANFADRPRPDLILTVAGPAATFARRHRQQLFPATPLLVASVDARWLLGTQLGENESVVAVDNDFPRLIEDILQLLPDTRHVFMVVGSGDLGAFWHEMLEEEFKRFGDRVTFGWSDGMSLDDLQHHCANLPSGSAIIYITFGADARGGAYADAQVLAELHAQANAPLFGSQSSLLGHGIVGGSLMSIEQVARSSADAAWRILHGEPAGSIRIPPQAVGQPIFDWRELQRWNIPESRLPPGSVVKFRRPTLWDEYKLAIVVAIAVLIIQSLLILRLLYEHRARQRAEMDSRRNLSLAADANRRETMSALTTSIGHELAQPLSAVMNNAHALQRMAADNRLSPEELREILADIESGALLATRIFERHRTMLRGRQLQSKPIELHAVIDESLSLLGHDLRARQVGTTLDLSSTPCVVDGDQVLLEQVLINLIRNAMDAIAETPSGMHRITIRSTVMDSDIELSVSDTGPGLPAHIIGTLFTPFVTTKSNGLGIGLTIVRSIVEAHGGTINAQGNADGGATFTLTLPRSRAQLGMTYGLGAPTA